MPPWRRELYCMKRYARGVRNEPLLIYKKRASHQGCSKASLMSSSFRGRKSSDCLLSYLLPVAIHFAAEVMILHESWRSTTVTRIRRGNSMDHATYLTDPTLHRRLR